MFRVSPETATVAPHQAAQLKNQPRKSTPSVGFEALIDSNVPVESHSNRSPRTADAPAQQARDNPAHKTDQKSGHQTEARQSGKNKSPAQTDNSNDARAIADDGATQDAASTDIPDDNEGIAQVDATLDPSAVLTDGTTPSDIPTGQTNTGDASAIAPVAVAIFTAAVTDSSSAPVQDTASAPAIASATTALAATATAVTAAENAAATIGETTSAAKAAKDAIIVPIESDTADVTTATADTTEIAIPTAPNAKASAASASTASANGNVAAETVKSSSDAGLPSTPAFNPLNSQPQQSTTDAADAKHGKQAIESTKTETSDQTPSAAHAAATPAGEQHTTTASAHLALSDQGQQASNAHQPSTFRVETVAPQPQPTALTSPPVPLSGLAVEIAQRSVNGKSSFEIRLDPAELGKIDVRLDVDKNGQVTSYLTVEKPSTLELLRRDAPQLQQALEDAGLKTGDSGLQFSLRDQSSSGHNHDDGKSGRNAQRLIITEDDTPSAHIAGKNYGRTLGVSSGVDIRV